MNKLIKSIKRYENGSFKIIKLNRLIKNNKDLNKFNEVLNEK